MEFKENRKFIRRSFCGLIIALLFLSFLACNIGTGGVDESETNIHVILIGLDGWGSYSLQNENHLDNMPFVRTLMSNGAYTLKNLCVMPSITAPNWESMFTGVTPEKHGITENPGNIRNPQITDDYGFYPNIFSVMKKQKPDSIIGYFYEKSGRMEYLVPPETINKMMYIPDLSNDPQPILGDITDFFKNDIPDLTCIIFKEPDTVGHTIGHDTEAYYEKLEILDDQIKEIVQATKDVGLYDDTVFILSADHGGVGLGHGNDTPAEREIPFIIFGKRIKQGHIITSEVNTYDTAAIIAYILNIHCPDEWMGRPVLEAFK
jgi:predicted AlkP superfamily pyrophosphatase or phosphodiesterase